MSKIYAIVGPTGSGKTKISLTVSKILNADIISLDSALIYKKMDIGTAKPTQTERDLVQHHMIDIIEPWDQFSVVEYLNHVKNIVSNLISQNKNILFVGGTMMYLKILIEGITRLPEKNLDIRKNLEMEVKKKGLDVLHKKLTQVDPSYAKKIKPADKQRIMRALEVYLISNKPFSNVLVNAPKIEGIDRHINTIAIVPFDRFNLHNRIKDRFDIMLARGMLEEVSHLKSMPNMHEDLSSMRSVGYRQCWQYLDGKINYSDMISKGLAATRQLAKRQITWINNWNHPITKIFMEDLLLTDRIIENHF